MSNNPDFVNKHGLHTSRANSKLRELLNNTTYYRPDEIARDLVKLAFSIDPQATVNTAQSMELSKIKCGQ